VVTVYTVYIDIHLQRATCLWYSAMADDMYEICPKSIR